MIELKHLRKEYPDAVPLKDVNTVIKKGDIIGVIGPSGTGKSTLLRCINLLCKPTSGNIIIDGEDIMSPGCNIDMIRRKIGMVFQSFNLYQHISVVENIMLAQTDLLGRNRQEAYDIAIKLLDRVGLRRCAFHYPGQLSGGQQQRVAIARTLATDPEIILFDEPTSALDPLMVSEVEYVIQQLAQEGRTMLVVTHEIDFARNISNRIFYMDEGGIYEDGTPEQIFNHPRREKTKNFIYRMTNMEIDVEYDGFDLQKAMENILTFGSRHMLSAQTIMHLQLVFEEECINYLKKYMQPDDKLKVVVVYAEKNGKVEMVISHSIKEVIGSSNKMDKLSFIIAGAYIDELTRTPLEESPDGFMEKIFIKIK